MKFWKHTLIGIFSFLGIASTVLLTSCNDDPCYSLMCRNKGVCTNGYCACPSGYEGAQCEVQTITRYLGNYYGNTKIDQKPVIIDSAIVTQAEYNIIRVMVYSGKDVLNGTVNGNDISTSVVSEGNYNTASINIENGKLTVYVEKIVKNEKTIYTFVGQR